MSVPRYWREIPQRYRLLGKKCVKCGTCFEICPPKIKAVSKYTGKKRNKVVNNENRARVERERKG